MVSKQFFYTKIMSTCILFTSYGFTIEIIRILKCMDCPNSLPLKVPHYNP